MDIQCDLVEGRYVWHNLYYDDREEMHDIMSITQNIYNLPHDPGIYLNFLITFWITELCWSQWFSETSASFSNQYVYNHVCIHCYVICVYKRMNVCQYICTCWCMYARVLPVIWRANLELYFCPREWCQKLG